MMATRPSSGARAVEGNSSVCDEKSIPGVGRDVLKEERKPLLDLNDVEQLERELSVCFDAPPPPPLYVRPEEASANVPWTGSSRSPHVDARFGSPPSLAATNYRYEPQQQQRERVEAKKQPAMAKEQTQTRLVDFSSLYSQQRAVPPSSLYPAIVPPTAPSSQAACTDSAAQAQAAAVPSTVQTAATPAAGRRAAFANWRPVDLAGEAVGRQGNAMAAVGSVDSSAEIIEELLSENEKLRLIIGDMSEELERVTLQNGSSVMRTRPTEPVGAVLPPPASTWGGAGAVSQQRTLESTMTLYPGAQAEANRRRNEERQRRRQPGAQSQEHSSEQQQQQLERGVFVHFKCENCPQWLKVPRHSRLVFCPICSYTSQMTATSRIHVPQSNTSSMSASH